ncbi:uncharacterized protein LOC106766307 [Vigna radiata var. radiata]|uniref:Uncharacterized protein LOC106766307 n=1 Tax=Vigna radiata var. radiata TaxID=3916 RepID=A0A1S3UKR9_VIGRR|nr:uncharacterized protein LOC106766307 [Vigna radiata var. radiata]
MAFAPAKPFSNNSLIHTTKHPPKPPLLLKDYLRDDLSSCSSNGFKSLPRRQCCTTVGFFVEKDLQLQRKRNNTLPRRRRSSVSALQRASVAVINAIKSLPMSQKGGRAKTGGVLCRSLSRKLLSRSFWRKAAVVREDRSQGVPRRRTSFRELIMLDQEHQKATSFNEYTALAAPSFTTSSGCGSNSWGESEFTFASTAASSESSNENYLLLETTKDYTPRRHKVEEEVVTKEYWGNEKEQFSPVSILDCPFVDEEEIYKSRFRSTSSVVSITEGRKQKLMHKRYHFESVASPEPVVLEKRFSRLELGDETLDHSTKRLCPAKNDDIEEKARNLVNLVKGSNPRNSLIHKAEKLLFDYFKKSIGECKDIDLSKKLELCKVAEDWINGRPQEVYLDWEEQGGRSVYVREMERCEGWKKYDEEIQELGGKLANEVLAILVNESVLDLMIGGSH